MKFEITILGSGSAVPTLMRNTTAQIVNIQEKYMMVDCGEGTQMQMRRFGVKMQRINHIFISHIHGDHYLGLPGFLQTLHLLGRTSPIYIYGPQKLKQLITMHFEAIHAQLRYTIHFVFTQNKEPQVLLENDQFEVISFPLKHKIPTTGFLFKEKPKNRHYNPKEGDKHKVPIFWIERIKQGEDYRNNAGKIIKNDVLTLDADPSYSYAYCSDTAYKEAIAEMVKGVDLLYHEASFLEDKRDRAKVTMHSTASDAAKIAKQANAKKLLLGHFSARYNETTPFIQEAKPFFENVEAAEDGMVIVLGS